MTDSELIIGYNKQLILKRKEYSNIANKILLIVSPIAALLIALKFIFLLPDEVFIITIAVWFVVFGANVIFRLYTPERPFYDFLVSQLILRLASYNGTELRYQAYPKDSRTINRESGLFPKYCSVTTKAQIQSDMYDIYLNTRIFTSDGKTTYQYFNGHYMIIHYDAIYPLQIKTKYKPYVKGVKFNKIQESLDFDLYIDEKVSDINYEPYVEYMERLKTALKAKNIYLSFNMGKVYFAYESYDLMKKPKVMTEEIITIIISEIENIIKVSDEIIKLITE